MIKGPIVTIDGPGGTGKSTVAKLVAEQLGIEYLDTGAFYRAATLAVIRSGVDASDTEAVSRVVGSSTFTQSDGRMTLNGEDVSDAIRSIEITSAVSAVSAISEVRRILVGEQRRWVTEHGGAVVEGRDIGSVVFPDAECKFYLDASPEVRARRRAGQDQLDEAEVLTALIRRDSFDVSREASPLTVPRGAVVIDTSDLTIDEVVGQIVTRVSNLR